MPKTLGLDLGIASIGWCLYDCKERNIADSNGVVLGTYYSPYRILDLGCFIFNQIEDPKSHETENVTRRTKRLMRRQRRRKIFRLKLVRELFKSYFHVDFLDNIVAAKKVKESPFIIKAKGLEKKLTPEELMVALYHYAKWRGFKSNRKSADKKTESDNKVMLSGISKIKEELAKEEKVVGAEAYITPLLLKKLSSRNDAWDNTLHNVGNIYHLTVDRETYEKEIVALLDKQISFGVIDEQFKDNYLKIWRFQRLYSQGPNDGPYVVDLEARIAACKFDKKKRAPKESVSARKFVLASALVNLQYKFFGDKEYRRLSKEEIQKSFSDLIYFKDITYASLFKNLGLYDSLVSVKSLTVSKKEKVKIINELKEKYGIGDGEDLTDDLYDAYSKKVREMTFKNKLVPSSEFIPLAKKLAKEAVGEKEKQFVDSDDYYDTLAKILLIKKDDESIRMALQEDGRFGKKLIDAIIDTDIDSKAVIDLSIDICRKITPLMVNAGMTYDQAMSENGYISYDPNGRAEVMGHIPPIDQALKEMGIVLLNPVVKHTLVQLRKLINAIVDKYGLVDDYVVEMSRQLKASKKVRLSMRDNNLESQFDNNVIRNRMIEQFPERFRNYASIKKNDLIRYKLYEEQGGISPYTNQPIPFRQMFSNDYQIDHIMPFSQSFDDSFSNKVLVEAKANQEKGNALPIVFRDNIQVFLAGRKFYSYKKKENLLRDTIPEDFLNKDFEDSAYIARLGKDLITFFMLPKGKRCRSTSGGITDVLRRAWRLTGKSHTYYKFDSGSYVSYENNLYQVRFYQDFLFKSVEKKIDKDVKTLTFDFVARVSGKNEDVSIELKTEKEKVDKKGNTRALSCRQTKLNEAIDYYFDHESYYLGHFGHYIGKDFEKLLESITGERVDSENKTESLQKEHGLTLLSEIRVQIQDIIDKKDRSNNLHHAIDAAVIGAVSQGLIQQISVVNRNMSDERIDYPRPYDGFTEEVLARVYERDSEKLLRILNSLPQYKDKPLSKYDVHVLIPVRQPSHDVEGPISGETIFGARKYPNGDLILTKTLPVDKLKKDDLEKIVDYAGGNKAVYDAIKVWMDNKKKTKYPVLAKKGTFVKKVKVFDCATPKEIVRLSDDDDRFAANSTVVRVDVYSKPGSPNLYFVPVFYHQIWKLKQNAKESKKFPVSFTLMRSKNEKYVLDSAELERNYKCVLHLPKGSLVEITMDDGERSFLGYTVGLSNGILELSSPIGDLQDAVYFLHGSYSNGRIQLTCSKIKTIKARSLSVLGKLS